MTISLFWQEFFSSISSSLLQQEERKEDELLVIQSTYQIKLRRDCLKCKSCVRLPEPLMGSEGDGRVGEHYLTAEDEK